MKNTQKEKVVAKISLGLEWTLSLSAMILGAGIIALNQESMFSGIEFIAIGGILFPPIKAPSFLKITAALIAVFV